MTLPIFRLHALFDQLVVLPESEREAFLARQADLSPATRDHLRNLVSADAFTAELTAWPAIAADAAPPVWNGRRVGPYEITRELGQGGMGSVFLAERVDGGVTQQVAIKIVRPERLDANTLARFRLERQVLALLQHPNIPGMLDLGELSDGSPYAVMDYVSGVPITDYARQQYLGVRERLALFLQVCDAVSYAHGNMIVHRDIKPGNVLVDGAGRPQLLDFGIAKPLLARLGAISVEETQAANRFLSLAHASPEQLRGEAATAACDVYGLGTLLYQLLAGVAPFTLGERTPAQLEREICETDPPPPSRRAAANTQAAVARDLDLITLRCLRKRPSDRYASVADLAADVRRYLDGRPVLARQGNFLYRAGRFISRHRGGVAMAALLFALAVVAGALLWRQQLATVAQQTRADDMTNLISDALGAIGTSGSSEISAREVFERVAAQAQASQTLGVESRVRISLAVARVLIQLRQFGDALQLIDKVRDMPGTAEQRHEMDFVSTRALIATAKYEEADAKIDAGLAAATPVQRAEWQVLAGMLKVRRLNPHDALALFDALDYGLLRPNLQSIVDKERAGALLDVGRVAEAVTTQEHSIERLRVLQGADSPAVYAAMLELAEFESRRGNIARTEAITSQVLPWVERNRGRESLDYLMALQVQSIVDEHKGDLQKSLAAHQQMLAINDKHYGQRSRNGATMRLNLAELHNEIGDYAQAETYWREGLDIAQAVLRPDDGNLFLGRVIFSQFLCQRDKPAQAQEYLRLLRESAAAHAALSRQDVARMIPVLERLAAFQLAASPANRKALAQVLKDSLGKSDDVMIEQMFKDAAAKARTLGVTAEP